MYDIALVCTPDEAKLDVLEWLVSHGKHVLVEKPLLIPADAVDRLQAEANRAGVVCYTAYNHRFEPHFVRMRDLLASGDLGTIYSCRMFYGNGTAELVRQSGWRDTGAGVVPDLGSHLLDTCRFWFGPDRAPFTVVSARQFENAAVDHAVLLSDGPGPLIELEMTLCMWRNHFTCDVLAENGSAHIESLCKWGPSTFRHRTRVRPSGRPSEISITLVQPDPTWEAEFDHFLAIVEAGGPTDLSGDRWIQGELDRLSLDLNATAHG